MNARSSINLDTYSLSLLTAKEDIVNPRSSTNWALFSYDGISNKLKLADSGAGGVAELAGKFNISKPQYGLCKMGRTDTGGPWIAMICWVGQDVDDFRKTECTTHISAIKNFFKEAHTFMPAEKVEDVTEERIKAEISKAQANAPTHWVRRSSRSADKEEIVGTNYRKTNAAMEMRRINRDSFWARAEREEEARKEEEKRRALEERRRLERERVLKERREAEERDRKMNEKLQMIEEKRRRQAKQEEELRSKEKLRWEEQQREHEEDMRARLRRSESIEKAAEAAVLVSQRSMNPREFFRQLSSSSSLSPTSPGSSRPGKPFRRYQRSLTDTAFIFSKAEENAAISPHTSPLVSPFSRAPPSPMFRAISPSASPDFHSVASPQKARAPVSPPASPLRPTAPVSALPSVPPNNSKVQDADKPKAPSPTEPSAPPASPTFLAAFSHNSLKSTQSLPEDLPALPPNSPTELQPEESTFCFEPGVAPQPPTVPLPERPNTELHSNVTPELVIGFKVQAVLLEEDEDEDVQEEEEHKCETQPQPCAVATELIQQEQQEEEELSKQRAASSQPEASEEVVTKEEDKCETQPQPCAIVTELIQPEQVEQEQQEEEDLSEQRAASSQPEASEEVVTKEDDKCETQPQPCAVVTELSQPEQVEQEQQEEEELSEQKGQSSPLEKSEEVVTKDEEEDKCETQPPCAIVTELIQPEEVEQEQQKEEELSEQKGQSSPPGESEEVVTQEEPREEEVKENVQSEDSQDPAECVPGKESAVTEAEDICQQLKQDTVILTTNGMTNGEDTAGQNGIERSLSPSDTELSSPELPVCYAHHDKATEEENVAEDEEDEVSENGQMVSAEAQMCVRALYDYQAEDDSEISFEPGDIIRDVETVDKAWWKGWSKDGRQGLFPANYVETI